MQPSEFWEMTSQELYWLIDFIMDRNTKSSRKSQALTKQDYLSIIKNVDNAFEGRN